MNRRQWIKASVTAGAGLWVSSKFPARKQETFYSRASFSEEIIRLDNNENPYGVATKAHAAITDAIRNSHRYPHKYYSELTRMIAAKEAVSAESVILGAGSTEIMNMAILAYGLKGEILTHEPTYFDFIFFAEQAGGILRRVPVGESMKVNLEALASQLNSRTSLVYICNPNNPTGTIIPADELLAFCHEASRRALVLVDEAYHEYTNDRAYSSMVSLVKEWKNVLVTRTFSKIYGLAGLRVGYGLAHPQIVENLKKVQMNFASIAYPSLRAAIAAYSDDEFIRSVKEKTCLVKSYLEKELGRLGYYWVPSQTNFVLFEVSRNSKELAAEFEKHRILVRPFAFGGRNWIRVSVGTMEEIKAFLSALQAVEKDSIGVVQPKR